MNMHPATNLRSFEWSLYFFLKCLMNSRLRHTSTMIPIELDSTLPVSSNTFSAPNECCEYTAMITSLRMNSPPAASSVHFREDAVNLFPDCIFGKSCDIPTTHHPSISVVTAVDTACTAYGELMSISSMEAPTVPNR